MARSNQFGTNLKVRKGDPVSQTKHNGIVDALPSPDTGSSAAVGDMSRTELILTNRSGVDRDIGELLTLSTYDGPVDVYESVQDGSYEGVTPVWHANLNSLVVCAEPIPDGEQGRVVVFGQCIVRVADNLDTEFLMHSPTPGEENLCRSSDTGIGRVRKRIDANHVTAVWRDCSDLWRFKKVDKGGGVTAIELLQLSGSKFADEITLSDPYGIVGLMAFDETAWCQNVGGRFYATDQKGESSPRLRICATTKATNRTFSALVDLVHGNTTVKRGDTITVHDPGNGWPDVVPGAEGWAYLRPANDYGTPTTADDTPQRWEVEDIGLPVDEFECTLDSCLKSSDSTAAVTVTRILSSYNNVVRPPELTGVSLTVHNVTKFDGMEDSKAVIRRRRTNNLLVFSDPKNLASPKAQPETTFQWELLEPWTRKARMVLLSKTSTGFDFVSALEGADPQPCGMDVICKLDCSCLEDGDQVYARYDPTTDKYEVISSDAAVAGSLQPFDVMLATGFGFDGCAQDYIQVSARLACTSVPATGTASMDVSPETVVTSATVTGDSENAVLELGTKTVYVCASTAGAAINVPLPEWCCGDGTGGPCVDEQTCFVVELSRDGDAAAAPDPPDPPQPASGSSKIYYGKSARGEGFGSHSATFVWAVEYCGTDPVSYLAELQAWAGSQSGWSSGNATQHGDCIAPKTDVDTLAACPPGYTCTVTDLHTGTGDAEGCCL